MVFKDQESGNGLAVWFQLKVPHQSPVKLLTGVQCSHGLSGAAGATSKLTHVAVDRRLHLISMGDRSPDGSWFSPKQVIQEREEREHSQSGNHSIFQNRISDATYCNFWQILLVTQTDPGTLCKRTTEGYHCRASPCLPPNSAQAILPDVNCAPVTRSFHSP